VHELLLVCFLAAAAYTVKGITGAASAVVFNSGLLLALVFGLAGELTLLDGLYWIALTDAISGLLLVAALRRQIAPDAVSLRLLAGYLPVTVLFTVLLTVTAPGILQVVLALCLVLAGAWLSLRRDMFGSMPPDRAARWALPAGLGAGVMGGLFGMGGPITFLLLAPASRDPAQFRARVLFVFTIANLVRLGVLAAAGGYSAARLELAAWSAPAVLAAMALGLCLHRHVKPVPFRVGLGMLVALSGAAALMKLGVEMLV
jgi:uncharacterized membrane protein YfcA